MPEGPECYRCAEVLNKKLTGRTMVGVTILNAKTRYYKTGTIPGIGYLGGTMTIISVTSKGKKIIFQVQREDESMIYLISFLGMAGRWQYTQGAHSGLSIDLGERKVLKHQTLKIIRERIYFEDQRHFGSLQVVYTAAEIKHVFKDTGIDPLRDKLTLKQYSDAIRNKRIKHWQICKFMLEQKYIASTGNYLKAEILYECQISPYRSLESLTDRDVELLYRWTLYVMKASLKKGGLTISTYKDPNGKPGTYKPKVYMQKTCPLGHPVVTITLTDKRTTHWVPSVQV